jgi:hypothetical protein
MKEHPNLPTALAHAQVQFPAIRKDGEAQAGPRKYNYITLDEINRKCVPVLAENGLVMTHEISGREHLKVVSNLIHVKTGDNLTSSCPLLIADGGNRMQSLGSARTYAMRYNTGSLLNIAVDFDDDGAAAGESQEAPATATDKQLKYMESLFEAVKVSQKKREDWASKVSSGRTRNCAELTTSEAGRVIDHLAVKKDQATAE